MNPKTNRFEPLTEIENKEQLEKFKKMLNKTDGVDSKYITLLRPDGSKVPEHWAVFREGEDVVIKNYTFKVKAIGETYILFEPVGPVLIGKQDDY